MSLKNTLTSLMLLASASLLAESAMASQGLVAQGYDSTLFEACLCDVSAISIAKKEFKKDDHQEGQMGYSHWQARLGAIDFNDQESSVDAFLGFGIAHSRLTWDNNPYGQLHGIYNALVEGAYTLRCDSPLSFHGDAHVEAALASRSSLLAKLDLYGSYKINDKTFSLGLYTQLGRRNTFFSPVIGLQMPLVDKLSLDLLFPFHAKVNYALVESADIYLAARSLKDRQRSKDFYWEYQATTAAIGATYKYEQMFKAELEAGQALNPRTRCEDLVGHKLATLHAKDSLFIQAALTLLF